MTERRWIPRTLPLMLVCAMLILVAPGASPGWAGFPVGAYRVRNWSAEFMGRQHSFSRTEAVAHAKRFDVIAAIRTTYDEYVAAMKSANPDLVMLAYMNGAFVRKTQQSAYPPRWYARDKRGRKIQSKYGNYLMDLSRPKWIDDRAVRCARFIAYSGYDGCNVDMLGTAPLEPGYLTAMPINRATGRVWTKRQWLIATGRIAAAIKERVGSHKVVGNGLRSGSQYFGRTAPSRRLLRSMDGGIAESWIRYAMQGIDRFRSVRDWRKDVNMLGDAADRGKTVLTMTKVWVSATSAKKDRWHKFALGSFLLGQHGKAYFAFSYSPQLSFVSDHAYWNLKLGNPLGPYAKESGVFQRRFQYGRVLVNPSDSRYTVSLGKTYLTPEGDSTSSVILAPGTAEILTTR